MRLPQRALGLYSGWRRRVLAAAVAAGLLTGSATGSYTEGAVTYSSPIDVGITNLKYEYSYDPGFRNGPLLVLMHGYGEAIPQVTATHRRRMAALGFVVVVVGMRGRDGASGARDASGREIDDIIRAIREAQTRFAGRVHPRRVVAVGYSGGGGNVLALLAKAPDLACFTVSHFGPSDYGYRFPSAWYWTNAAFAPSLEIDVGATPAGQPGWWQTRDHVSALATQLARAPHSGHRLALFHDSADVAVDVTQSDRVLDTLTSIGRTDLLDYHRSTPSDSVRYTHGYPGDSPGVLAAEADWVPRALAAEPWTVRRSGALLVPGFLQTERLECFLGPTDGTPDPRFDPLGGMSDVGRIDYDLDAGELLLTPLTGDARYRVQIGAQVYAGTTSGPVALSGVW